MQENQLTNSPNWLNDIDACIDVLAAAHMRGQAKRAYLTKKATPGLMEQAGEAFNRYVGTPVSSAFSEHVQPAFNQYIQQPLNSQVLNSLGLTDDVKKHIGYGLMGAGLGAGAGLASQAFTSPGRRRPLSALLAGGLLGGTLGAGGSMVHSNWNSLNRERPSETAADRRTREEDLTNRGQQGLYSDRLDAQGRAYAMTPEHMQRLDRYVRQDGRAAGHDAFLNDAERDNGPAHIFQLPARHTANGQIPHALAEELSGTGMERRLAGFNPSELRALTTPEARQAFINDVINRQSTEHSVSREQWTPETLAANLDRLIRSANNPVRQYNWRNIGPEGYNATTRRVIPQVLDELRQNVDDTNMSGPLGRRATDLFHRVNQGAQRIRGGDVAGGALHAVAPLGVVPGSSPANEGLGRELARMITPTRDIGIPDPNNAQLAEVIRAGFTPTELRDAYLNPGTQDDLINRVVRNGVQGPDGQPWTHDALRAALPDLMQRALAGTGTEHGPAGNFLNQLNTDNMLSTGSTGGDVLALTAGADAVGSVANLLRNRHTGFNPDHLRAAIRAAEQAGTTGGVTPEQFAYLQHVNTTQGVAGLRRLGSDPSQYLGTNTRVNSMPWPTALGGQGVGNTIPLHAGAPTTLTHGQLAAHIGDARLHAAGGQRAVDWATNYLRTIGGVNPAETARANQILQLAQGTGPLAATELRTVASAMATMLRNNAAGGSNNPAIAQLLHLPESQLVATLEQALSNPGWSRSVNTAAPTQDVLAAMASRGQPGLLRRAVTGRFAGIPLPRWAGYAIPQIGSELLFHTGQPGRDRAEQLLQESMNAANRRRN